MIRRAPTTALLLLAMLPLGGCITIDLPIGTPRPLVETAVHGDGAVKIVMIQLEGVLTEEAVSDSLFSPGESRVARLREELDKARRDPAVRALLLRINSPGGTVTASDILYQQILAFKRESGIPVVAQLMGVAASGGYYVAMAADEVVAQPTTVTGSIGVIFGSVNIAGLMEKVGVEDQTLVSGPYKDAGSILREMTPAEREQLQSVLNDLYARFVSVVEAGRSELAPDAVARLADGRIYSAPQALENGLVDRIGSLPDAIDAAERAAGVGSSRVVTYHRPREFRENVYSVSTRPPQAGLAALWSALPARPSTAFLYLWTPGAW